MSKPISASMAQQKQIANLEPFAERLRRSVLDVLWQQWHALGAQAAGKGRAHAIVDPEALVMMSLILMDEERRLGDLVQSWTVQNSDLLSVQRAKNLAADYPESARQGLAWFARIALTQGKDMRWRSLSVHGTATDRTAIKSLRANKKRAIRVRASDPAALMLRLRLGFGVGAKSDVLGYLLGIAGEWASIRDISTATAYTVAGIRRAVEDMAAARLIHSTTGPPAAYRADPETWSRVLGLAKEPPLWRNWHQRFAFVAVLLAWTKTARRAPLSVYAAGVRGRELMDQYRSAFAPDVVEAWSEHTPVTNWLEFVEKAVSALAHWMPAHA
jgi:hypothetical protein